MDNLFMVLLLISMLALLVFAIKSIVAFIKKNGAKGKKMLKFTGISFIAIIITAIGVGATAEPTENKEKEETVAKVEDKAEEKKVTASEEKEAKEKKEAEDKAKEAEKKAAAEQKAKEEAEAKKKATADKLAKEVEYYKNTLSPKLDSVQNEYDRIWSEQWVTTFNGISDGSVDVYTAYKQMTFIETNYAVLEDTIGKISGDNLSSKNKKLLKSYKEKLSKAADYRSYAASEAAKMFDNGTFKPSELDSIKSIVSSGDGEMTQAVFDRLQIEDNLGLVE